MIDPYILPEADGSFLCFFKQNGVSISSSRDLRQWTFLRHTSCGENVCVLRFGSWYGILHSPANGVGLLFVPGFGAFYRLRRFHAGLRSGNMSKGPRDSWGALSDFFLPFRLLW